MPIVSVNDFLSAKIDFLVVGGGTSGLTIATRIAESTQYTVGVIEAGKDHEGSPLVDIPGMMTKAFGNPELDWAFSTAPEKFADSRQVYLPRGKGLGGSSLINFMAFVRPAKEEVDAFEKLGNPKWNWNDTFYPLMKKSERLMTSSVPADKAKAYGALANPAYHGTQGRVAKSFPPLVSDVHVPTLDTLEKFGVPRVMDNSGGRPVGSFLITTSVDSDTAKRSTSASAYYSPNSGKKNLLVLTEAQVSKIGFANDGDLKRATHVEFSHGEKTFTVNVSKEVILSAGSYQTPQLLELSGIGNAQILRDLGVNCLVDNPAVGENLQDHVLTPVVAQVSQDVTTLEVLLNPSGLEEQQELYKQQKGILAGMLTSFFSFVPTKAFVSEAKVKEWKSGLDAGIVTDVSSKTPDTVKRGIEKQFKHINEWFSDEEQTFGGLFHVNGHVPAPDFTPDTNKRYLSIYCAQAHPLSRGTVHAASAKITDPPTIHHNYYSNPVDLDVQANLVSLALKVLKTSPLSDKVEETVVPKVSADDHEGLKTYIKQAFGSCYHPSGTASMLPKNDGGVVDPNLKVYGTANLRVVDCSIIPLLVSCNIQSLAYAIGEKAAQIIIDEY